MVIWQLDNPVDGQPWLYWEHDWHGGGIVGCGQPLGQGGGAVVWEHPLHGCGRKQTEHWGAAGNAGDNAGWKHGKHGGRVVGCGQFWGQKGRVVICGHPLHGCGAKHAEQEGDGVGGNVGNVTGWQGIPI